MDRLMDRLLQKEKSNQKDGYSSSDGLPGKDIAPVVTVLSHSVDARQHGQAHQSETDEWAGQTASSGPGATHDVHLNRKKSSV